MAGGSSDAGCPSTTNGRVCKRWWRGEGFREHLLDGALGACVASHAAGAAISQLRAAPCCSQVVAIPVQVQEIHTQIDRPADAPPLLRRAPPACAPMLRLLVSPQRGGRAAPLRSVLLRACAHFTGLLSCSTQHERTHARTHAGNKAAPPRLFYCSKAAVIICTWPPPPQPRNCFTLHSAGRLLSLSAPCSSSSRMQACLPTRHLQTP